ncbi:hypothetical protein GCM10029978_054150 [Actinoallomurus acanthiterrae]
MRREWELEDLIECWTLDEAELELSRRRHDLARLLSTMTLHTIGRSAHRQLKLS